MLPQQIKINESVIESSVSKFVRIETDLGSALLGL